MSKVTRIALVGASGMIGTALIRLAVGRADLRIVAVARRELKLLAYRVAIRKGGSREGDNNAKSYEEN